MKYYLGVDLGGTNIVAGLVDGDANILARDSVRTNIPRRAEDICGDIAALCARIMQSTGLSMGDVEWIGIGSPGIILDGVVRYANNLQFCEEPLAAMVERMTGKTTLLQNDGNAAAYGELLVGAGRGHRSLIAITLGTGVGGGIVIDNRIHSGFNGAAGEIGHTVIHYGGRLCTCGKAGCIEAYCSATAIRKITAEAMERHPESRMWQHIGQNGRISAKTPFAAAREGDSAAKKVVDEFLLHLSIAVSNAINLLQPEVVCIGGGVSREGDYIIEPVRELVAKQTYLPKEEHRTRIVASQLGDDAGLIGAA
ncbi:ROK family protein, partial [Ruminococcaceae bacterium OttesenSCG-928-L11]|nr:ROK family protein [Ruminococcaceae bacterium OttesenSCG-928-L11]